MHDLATPVTYTDSQGHLQAAIVIGTQESTGVKPIPADEAAVLAKHGVSPKPHNHRIPALAAGQVLLSVLSPTGSRHRRVAEFDAEAITYRDPKPAQVSYPVEASTDYDEDYDADND